MGQNSREISETELIEIYLALLEITKNHLIVTEKSPSNETHPLEEAVRRVFA